MRGIITQERLKELLDYDPETGVFTWRDNHGVNARAGQIAGKLDHHGHRRIKIDYREYAAHRLAFLYVTGTWPADQVDHVNLDKCDNRWINLREATRSQNAANTLVRRHSKTGCKGVYHCGRRFTARITINGSRKNLGCFDTADEAAAAYANAAKTVFGDFARY